MCTDLGQQAEPGVSDLGHRGQPGGCVRLELLIKYLAQEDGIQEALCIKLFGTRGWHSGNTFYQVIWHKRMAFRKHSKLKLFGTRGCCRPYMEVDCKASLNILTGDLIGTFVKLYDYLLI